ncbi:MAG: chromosome segregation protein SMC [Deltaproteobacteria bacterium]|nr:chromosome segregation protein SMC [Deltaproteobacteria bacterium]MBW2070143.1 chromosome segregation protein SMC [Deltaproteobacteria bacterium]
MHIKQLELYGFKSFVDKTVISFPTGICAVVGPNGCGKSNIVDAIRWVLGEQSAKQLRGKVMEQIIFSGTNGRPMLNFTEVSLVINNEQGKAPPPYQDCSEIMVTRRLFRSGDSEYLINKIPCRRMDITRLFLEAGIGHRHYAIIEQGRIGNIVESRPEDIRTLIEEAAGITAFKLKKKAALRKIDLTSQNLLRLGDIIAEVSRQLSSLKRQAQRANRYRTLKQEIKRLEIRRASHHYSAWLQQLDGLKKQQQILEDSEFARAAQLSKVEAELTEHSLKVQQQEELLRQKRDELFRLKSSISKDENQLQHIRERSGELQQRQQHLGREIEELHERLQQRSTERDRLAAEQEELASECLRAEQLSSQLHEELSLRKSQLSQLEQAIDASKNELINLLSELAGTRNDRAAVERHLQELHHKQHRRKDELEDSQQDIARLHSEKEQLEARVAASREKITEVTEKVQLLQQQAADLEKERTAKGADLRALESTFHRHQSRLAVLTEMQRTHGWFSDAVKTILQAKEKNEIDCDLQGIVAEMIEVDSQHRQAVEAVLGDRLQAMVVASPGDACRAMDLLKDKAVGRGHFLPSSFVTDTVPPPVTSSEDPVPLVELVRPRPGYEDIVHHLLGRVLFCPDLENALQWWQANPHTCTLVTADGDLLDRDGTLAGGSEDRQLSILLKQDEVRNLQRQVEETGRLLEKSRSELAALEERMLQTRRARQEAESERKHLEERLLHQENDLYRVVADLEKIEEYFTMVQVEQEHDAEERSRLQEKLLELQETAAEMEQRQKEVEQQISQSLQERRQLEQTVESLREKVTCQQVALGKLVEKREAARTSHLRLQEYYAETEMRSSQLQQELDSCKRQLASLAQQKVDTEQRLKLAHEKYLEQKALLQQEEHYWQQAESRSLELEQQKRELLAQERNQQKELQELRQQITELNLKVQYLLHEIQERYRIDLSKETSANISAPLDIDKIASKIIRLRNRVARIGEVNLTAIQEYEEQKKRLDFLSSQRDDLQQSLQALKKAISRINRTTRNRFLGTIEAVNSKLAEVFPLLFNGGTGRLQLLDEQDPLESGVEILVHPPGKRLTTMSLLSGGEKALAAVALLFSLYMIRPSPFCIMDEVDAPLDEANIDRFNQLVTRISRDSQIIMVTHNKRTMEICDVLLGVTMEEPGISKIISVNFKGISENHGTLVQTHT